eukprot:TRINITY_DN3654_c0_g2_i1.p1 TRINITY_DN3654_c0_g2~~TRINITY_DN3654_c0_g2_i1.p1  ORF type:complete len:452 (-),score=72.91 TRINITY_DN3654_c0_g2_i1:137-1492(-)
MAVVVVKGGRGIGKSFLLSLFTGDPHAFMSLSEDIRMRGASMPSVTRGVDVYNSLIPADNLFQIHNLPNVDNKGLHLCVLDKEADQHEGIEIDMANFMPVSVECDVIILNINKPHGKERLHEDIKRIIKHTRAVLDGASAQDKIGHLIIRVCDYQRKVADPSVLAGFKQSHELAQFENDFLSVEVFLFPLPEVDDPQGILYVGEPYVKVLKDLVRHVVRVCSDAPLKRKTAGHFARSVQHNIKDIIIDKGVIRSLVKASDLATSAVIEAGNRAQEMMNSRLDDYMIGDFRDQNSLLPILIDSWRLVRFKFAHLTSLCGVPETDEAYVQGLERMVRLYNEKKVALFNYHRQKGTHKVDPQTLMVTVSYGKKKEMFTSDFPKKAGYTLTVEQSDGNMDHADMTREVLDSAHSMRGHIWVKSKKFPIGSEAWGRVTFQATYTPIFNDDVVVANQ